MLVVLLLLLLLPLLPLLLLLVVVACWSGPGASRWYLSIWPRPHSREVHTCRDRPSERGVSSQGDDALAAGANKALGLRVMVQPFIRLHLNGKPQLCLQSFM